MVGNVLILRYTVKEKEVSIWVKQSKPINCNVHILISHIDYSENWTIGKSRYEKQLTAIAMAFQNILTEFYIFSTVSATPC